jgi:DNA repair protein RadD
VLDFGENIKRHGSLDDPEYGRDEVTTGTGGGEGEEKNCPNCGNSVAINYRTCPECQFKFPCDDKPRHDAQADEDSLLTGNTGPETWVVTSVSWARHTKRGAPDAPPTLRIDYYCQPADEDLGNLTETKIQEWVCIEHDSFARSKAVDWWQKRSLVSVPDTVDEALRMLDGHMCCMPSGLVTQKDGRWKRIVACEWKEGPPGPKEYVFAPASIFEPGDCDAFGVDDLPF